MRQSKLPDPAKIGNAGSFFKNPVIDMPHFHSIQAQWPEIPGYPVNQEQIKIPAAWLIDSLGFKGKQVGGVSCHKTQPLVLTNNGRGTGQDLLKLARQIKQKVQEVFAVQLEHEVRLVGKHGLITL